MKHSSKCFRIPLAQTTRWNSEGGGSFTEVGLLLYLCIYISYWAIPELQLLECRAETWAEVARLALPQSYEENELLFVANSRFSTYLALPIHVTDVNLPIEEDNWEFIYNSTESIWTNWDFNHPGSSGTLVDRCSRLDRSTSLWRRHYCTDYNTFACQVQATGLKF